MSNQEYLELYNCTANSFTREHILMELRSKHDRGIIQGRCVYRKDNTNCSCWLCLKVNTNDINLMVVSMNVKKDNRIINIMRMYDIETFESKFKVV